MNFFRTTAFFIIFFWISSFLINKIFKTFCQSIGLSPTFENVFFYPKDFRLKFENLKFRFSEKKRVKFESVNLSLDFEAFKNNYEKFLDVFVEGLEVNLTDPKTFFKEASDFFNFMFFTNSSVLKKLHVKNARPFFNSNFGILSANCSFSFISKSAASEENIFFFNIDKSFLEKSFSFSMDGFCKADNLNFLESDSFFSKLNATFFKDGKSFESLKLSSLKEAGVFKSFLRFSDGSGVDFKFSDQESLELKGAFNFFKILKEIENKEVLAIFKPIEDRLSNFIITSKKSSKKGLFSFPFKFLSKDSNFNLFGQADFYLWQKKIDGFFKILNQEKEINSKFFLDFYQEKGQLCFFSKDSFSNLNFSEKSLEKFFLSFNFEKEKLRAGLCSVLSENESLDLKKREPLRCILDYNFGKSLSSSLTFGPESLKAQAYFSPGKINNFKGFIKDKEKLVLSALSESFKERKVSGFLDFSFLKKFCKNSLLEKLNFDGDIFFNIKKETDSLAFSGNLKTLGSSVFIKPLLSPIKSLSTDFKTNFSKKNIVLKNLNLELEVGNIFSKISEIKVDEKNKISLFSKLKFYDPLFYTDGFLAHLSGALNFLLSEKRKIIFGDLEVKESYLKKDLLSQSFSQESFFVKEKNDIDLFLSLKTKKDLEVLFPELKTSLAFNLKLEGSFNQNDFSNIFSTGVVNFKGGQIKFLDNNLKLSEGILKYDKSRLGNPMINFSVFGDLKRHKVNLHFFGHLKDFFINTSAQPALTDEQIFSLFFTGSKNNSFIQALPGGFLRSFDFLFNQKENYSRISKIFKGITKPFKPVDFSPYIFDKSSSLVGASLGIDFGDKFHAFLKKSFNYKDDLLVDMEYLFSENFSVKVKRDLKGCLEGCFEFRVKF